MAYGAFGKVDADINKLTISYQFQSLHLPHTLSPTTLAGSATSVNWVLILEQRVREESAKVFEVIAAFEIC